MTIAILLVKHFNPIALRKAKIVYNFGLSECSRVKRVEHLRTLKVRHNYHYTPIPHHLIDSSAYQVEFHFVLDIFGHNSQL